MARRKSRPARKRREPVASCDDRLKLLAQELALAGGQILAEEFDITPEMVNRWMMAMTARARTNRVRLAVEQVKRERAESG